MCRGARDILLIAALLATAGLARGQIADEPLSGAAADERLLGYLNDHGLDRLLISHYSRKLSEGSADDRKRAAEELGKLYVKELSKATDNKVRAELEAKCQDFLKAVPEADTVELRITLAKTTFLKAEEIAERDRLRLSTDEEKAEALRILESVLPVFRDQAVKVQKKIEGLERREDNVRGDDLEKLRVELNDGKRIRSLARFYAGWTEVHMGALTGGAVAAGHGQSALDHFGWLLNATHGQPAVVDKLNRGLLRYDHIARAALGSAMACSERGAHAESLRWVDAIAGGDATAPAVLEQLFYRKISLLAAGGYWPELKNAVRSRRTESGDKPLAPAEARLLAVVALEASGGQLSDANRPITTAMAQTGLGDLATQGQLAEVLDLVKRYGVAPVGDSGFIANFVRAVQVYEKARDGHKKAGTAESEEPTGDAALKAEYEEAAKLFGQAAAADDSGKFADARTRGQIRQGWALFYAGRPQEAADRFQEAADAAPPGELRRDAAWCAIHALDYAVDNGRKELASRRDKLATLFLSMYPGTEQAARVLLRKSGAGLLPPDKAAEVLLALDPSSPVYDLARRQAARLMYDAFRRASPKDKDFAAQRFIALARVVLEEEMNRSATAGSPELAKEAAEAAVLRARQIADAALTLTAPDVSQAEQALAAIQRITLVHQINIAGVSAELDFVRLRIALAQKDDAAAEAVLAKLDAAGGEYAAAGRRVVFHRSLQTWQRTQSAEDARRVVRTGQMILGKTGTGAGAVTKDTAPTFSSVAEAAAFLWDTAGEQAMRDLALSLDKALLASGLNAPSVLRRIARLSEAGGDEKSALDAWRQLLTGLTAGEAPWFEARYESLRLLAKTDKAKAIEGLEQVKALYPKLGPEPWAPKLRKLDEELSGGGGS